MALTLSFASCVTSKEYIDEWIIHKFLFRDVTYM